MTCLEVGAQWTGISRSRLIRPLIDVTSTSGDAAEMADSAEVDHGLRINGVTVDVDVEVQMASG